MHGHRHIDWIGECAGLSILSAPSPVMGAPDDLPSYFYIQTFAGMPHGRLRLLPPERILVKAVSTSSENSATTSGLPQDSTSSAQVHQA